MTTPSPLVAIVLPPREGFGPGRTGALGLLARRHADTPGFRHVVFGGPQAGPVFPNLDFRAIVPTMWKLGSNGVRFAASLAGEIKTLNPALIEVHNRPEIALPLAKRFPNIPVSIILNNDPQAMRGAASASDRATLLSTLATTIVSSEYLRGRVLDGVKAPARNPVVLPNCLDLRELPPPSKRERLVLFAGRVVREKGVDSFVSAWAAAGPYLAGWHAQIVGADRFSADSPDTDFVQTIRGAADGAGVRMLGYRDHPEVLAAMARASIVVVPSRWPEPFGLVALEAMASGAALICSPRGGLPEVAGDCAVYADPDNPAEIAAAIRTLAGDDRRRAELGAMGRARARLFDVPAVLGQLAELRNAMLAG
jgi:glycosyltransferase involved in cell wall biosynthesis